MSVHHSVVTAYGLLVTDKELNDVFNWEYLEPNEVVENLGLDSGEVDCVLVGNLMDEPSHLIFIRGTIQEFRVEEYGQSVGLDTINGKFLSGRVQLLQACRMLDRNYKSVGWKVCLNIW